MSDPDLPLAYVHVEPDDPVDGSAPAVFVMHGRGADEQDLLPIGERFPSTLHVVSFRGPESLMRGYTWYDIEMPEGDLHRSQPDPVGYRRSLDLVSDSIEGAVEAFDLDPDRLGLLGFSMGSMITMGLLLERPERFAWGVALHGYLPATHADREPEGIADKPVFLGGGTRDDVIPARRVETAAERFRELGSDVTFGTYDVGHGVGQEELQDIVAFVEEQVG